ncbi:hypothetical protein APHAL10511_005468 [Amanita phalloides]|nr:hypothetical protein APHAL10511_005468 [Amanita phalloides]
MISRCQRTIILLLLFILTLTCGCYAGNATSIEDIFQTQLVARDDLWSRTKFSKRGKLAKLFKSDKPKLGKAFGKSVRRRFGAIGDVHGDLERTKSALKLSGVLNHEEVWSNTFDFFVQVGDVIDRGSDTIKLIKYLEELRSKAPKGHELFTLMGNHEFMNLQGLWEKVSPEDIKSFGGKEDRWKAISGWIGEIWEKNYITALWLPLHPAIGEPNNPHNVPEDSSLRQTPFFNAAYSFLHGGLSPFYGESVPFPKRINDISKGLIIKLRSRPVGEQIHMTDDEIFLLSRYNGPLWYYGWRDHPLCEYVDRILTQTRTRRMIVGHSLVPEIRTVCKGKVILIDTGISLAMRNSRLSALVVDYSVTHVGEKGGVTELEEKEEVKAVYSDPTKDKVLVKVARRIKVKIEKD